jgi:hypothetical protein
MATTRSYLLGFAIPYSTRSQSSYVRWVYCWRDVISIRGRKGAHAASNACSASEADRKRVVENPCSDTHSCLPRQDLHLRACQRPKAAHRKLLFARPVVLSPARVSSATQSHRGRQRASISRDSSETAQRLIGQVASPQGRYRRLLSAMVKLAPPRRGACDGLLWRFSARSAK